DLCDERPRVGHVRDRARPAQRQLDAVPRPGLSLWRIRPMAPPFVHLSVRSVYSLREGAIRLDELAARTRALGMHAVALTDRDSLAGAVRFTQACRRYGIQPIYGVRLTVSAAGSSCAPALLSTQEQDQDQERFVV